MRPINQSQANRLLPDESLSPSNLTNGLGLELCIQHADESPLVGVGPIRACLIQLVGNAGLSPS